MWCVNTTGIKAIKEWITNTTAHDDAGPLCSTDIKALDAWASEAEESFENCGSATIEMSEYQTRSGTPETFTLSLNMLVWYPQN